MDQSKTGITASRVVEIIENTFKDTIVIGYGVLYPGYVGRFNYLKNVYTKGLPEKSWPPTTELCINPYQNRLVEGRLIIRYFEKIDKK